MEKFTFSTDGAAQLISALYALSQPELKLEADQAGSDFRTWLKSHFTLDSSQSEYLDAIDELWVTRAAAEMKAFLEDRRPIVLEKSAPSSIIGDRGKLLDLEKKQVSSYSQEQGVSENERLVFSITYR